MLIRPRRACLVETRAWIYDGLLRSIHSCAKCLGRSLDSERTESWNRENHAIVRTIFEFRDGPLVLRSA